MMTHKIEMLSLDQMIPVKFQPLKKRHFIVEVPGIDSFLIKNIVVDSYSDPEMSGIVLKLHDPSTPSAMQQVYEWRKEGERSLVIKKIDPVGTIVSVRRFEGVSVKKITQEMCYDSGDLSEIVLDLVYKSEKLEF